MTEDITKPLQGMGTKTQEVIPYAMTGADVERVGMRKAHALRELAAGQEELGKGIGSALKSIGGAVERMGGGDSQDMARQGDIEGRNSVTRNEQGDIQVQPTNSSLFGKSGEHYSSAAYSGAVNAGRDQLRSDLTRIAAESAGDPEKLKIGVNGYLEGHLGGLGSGQVGQTLLLDAKDYGQQLVDGAITKKAASDIHAAERGILKSTESQQTDLEALAFGGAVDSDAYKTTLAAQQTRLDELGGNPAFGVSADEVAATRKNNAFRIQDATIQGAMGSAFHNGGLNASSAVVDSISTRTDLSDADKVRLKFSADAVLERQKSANSSDITTNQTAFNGLMELRRKGAPVQLGDWQDIQKRAIFLGDPDTAKSAGTEIANHHWVEKAVTLSPSQQDRANGVGVPHPDSGQPPDAALLINQGGGDVNRAVDDAFTKLGADRNINRSDLREYLRTGGHDLDPKTAAYCAAFVGAALQHAGIKGAASNLASDYLNWGSPVYGDVKRGDVLVVDKGAAPGQQGDHVGFATGFRDAQGRVEMVSGNTQGGKVATEYVDRNSVVARRYDPSGGVGLRFETRGASPQAGAEGLARGAVGRWVPTESDTRADKNFNPGNIAWSEFARAHGATHAAGIDVDHGVAVFPSPQAGFNAMAALALSKYNSGKRTADQLIAGEKGWTPGRHDAAADIARRMGLTPNADMELTNPDRMRAFQISLAIEEGAPRHVEAARGSTAGGARSTTWDDLHNNPGMAPTYIKALSAEVDTRSKYAETLIDSSTKSLKNNTPVSQENMVQIEQLATPEARAANPQLDAKYSEYEKAVVASHIATGGPSVIEQARAEALAQPDILPRQMVDLAGEIRKGTETQLKENPVAAALNGKMIGRPPAPLNPGDPQSIPLHFTGNAAVVDAISARELGFNKSVVFKNEVGAFGATMAGPVQAGLAVLSSLQALPRDKQDATLEMPEVRAAILGMANSTDPDKKRAAFAFMDHIYRQGPQTFEGKFEHKGLLMLRDWQDTQQFHTDKEIATEAATAYDPSTIRAREALSLAADKILKNFTPAAVANKLAPYWFAANTPISDATAQTNAILLEDHNRAFKEMYERHGNETSAYNFALEATKTKWGPSVANGDRVMAYPPEKSPAYPAINGSQDYIGVQLQEFVKSAGHAGAEAHLISGKNARAEMIEGKPVGYGVVVQGKDGQFARIDGLFYADPVAAQREFDASRAAGLSGPGTSRRTARDFFRGSE